MKQIIWFSRVSIFVVYFWFGILKALGVSPAESLVHQLFNITLSPLSSFPFFLISFGLFECLIGILWLIPKLTNIAYYALIFHFILIFNTYHCSPRSGLVQFIHSHFCWAVYHKEPPSIILCDACCQKLSFRKRWYLIRCMAGII